MRSICIAVALIGMSASVNVRAEPLTPETDRPPKDSRREQAVFRFQGGEITVGDVEDALAEEPVFVQRAYRDPEKLREYAQRMLRTRLLSREARRRELDEHPDVRRVVKKHAIQALIKETIDEKVTPESIPAEEVQAYFESHRDHFNHPATRRASHILVEDAERAAKLMKQAKRADLREFRKLARQHSQDEETKLRGGDLRYFDEQGQAPRGDAEARRVAEPIVEAAFSLQEAGDVVAKPVKVDGGYSIVMLTGKRPAVKRTWKDVEDTIRSRLWRKQRQEAVEQLVAELKKKHPPEVHPQPLADIDIEEPPPGSEVKPGFPREKSRRETSGSSAER